MTDIVVKHSADMNFSMTWSELSLGNCGMESIYSFQFQKRGALLDKPVTRYGIINYFQEYRPIPIVNTELESVYDILCNNLHLIEERLNKPLVFLSDKMVSHAESVTSLNRNRLEGFNFLDTAYLIRAIRKMKFGSLTLSPLVENTNHPAQSGIMAGFWIPPSQQRFVLHERSGYSCQPAAVKRTVDDGLSRMSEEFVKDFYGRGRM